MSWTGSRRDFLRATGATVAGVTFAQTHDLLHGQSPPDQAPVGERAYQHESVAVIHPQGRVPLSFIIDDSTCLVNMGHFCMPQFAAAWPDRDIYRKPWETWPREIPDSFVREFGEWCAEQGVRGKYSVVPYPACVGWLDRDLPGWSRRQLHDSLKLVRELLMPHWDIHPEMITHTRVIDLKTGRPYGEISNSTMENSYPSGKKSVDELAAYMAYALQILKNCDLPCEGITTPGGFGNGVRSELSLAVHEAVRSVFGTELPHYFKYIVGGTESTAPRLEHVRGMGTDDVRVTVNVPAGTGDYFGGWDGAVESQGHRNANEDATSGRMVELIERNEPAIMFCHWAGLYTNGTKKGFEDFQRIVLALNGRFGGRTVWMKVTEIARYWAARELTRIDRADDVITLDAPFAASRYTLRIAAAEAKVPAISVAGSTVPLEPAKSMIALKTGTWYRDGGSVIACFDLPKGRTTLSLT